MLVGAKAVSFTTGADSQSDTAGDSDGSQVVLCSESESTGDSSATGSGVGASTTGRVGSGLCVGFTDLHFITNSFTSIRVCLISVLSRLNSNSSASSRSSCLPFEPTIAYLSCDYRNLFFRNLAGI